MASLPIYTVGDFPKPGRKGSVGAVTMGKSLQDDGWIK